MENPSIFDLLAAVQQLDASDLFLAQDRVPSARINGSVSRLKREPLTKQELETFLREILRQEQWAEFQKTGDLDTGYTLPSGLRFRLNIARQQSKISIVARCIPSGKIEMDKLGLPPSVRYFVEHPSGIVLVTGATGSGKSTTLASLVHHINAQQRKHIVTIEDPIEFVHVDMRSRVTQREVGEDTHSFHEALRRVVRQSPDVILIGEMRDAETIAVALSAALTGHLVLSTVHTIDASQTLRRLVGYFPENMRGQVAIDLSLALRGIMCQRLLPKKDGSGRVLALELLTNTPAVAQLLRERRDNDLDDLMRASRGKDIFTFNSSLLSLFESGQIDRETALGYSTNRDELLLMMQGMRTSSQSRLTQQVSEEETPDMKKLLQLVLHKGASDLHLTVGRPPILRIQGQLVPQGKIRLGDPDMRMLLNSIMTARQRMVYELEKEVDFALSLEAGQRFRVNAYFQRGSMAAALRSIPSAVPDASALGLGENILQFADKPHGLVLVVGPTGSGKSTTLACMLNRINEKRACRIITIEDPIEFYHNNILATIDQRELHADTKSFASALKYILRQDPDVILVGEMRDQETIAAALTAAETGHLVFATLHTNDAVQTIDRIIDVFPAHQQDQIRTQLAASLQAVISQRLLLAVGGKRVAAFEVMVGTNAICNLIRERKMHQAIGMMEASKNVGMITMDASIYKLFEEGTLSKEEAVRYMRNPKIISLMED